MAKPMFWGVAADGGVDGDDLAIGVEQRPAGVAGVDGGVGLDEVGEVGFAVGLHVAANGGHDAGADAVAIAHGVADGDDGLADHEVAAIAELDDGEGLVAGDLEDREVGLGGRS